MNHPPSRTLIYDADCSLCVWSRQRLERWDRQSRIRFVPFQSDEFAQWFPQLDRTDPDGIWPDGGPPTTMLYVDPAGRMHRGDAAFRALLPELSGGRALALIYRIPGAPVLARRLYEWIARNRYRWFGSAECGHSRTSTSQRNNN
jgi:predicted DCC family thiol-disulfide oxidoreductase YuxK